MTETPREHLDRDQIHQSIDRAAIGCHWWPEAIKLRGRTVYMVRAEDVGEIVAATKAAVREQIFMALLGCDHPLGYCPEDREDEL